MRSGEQLITMQFRLPLEESAAVVAMAAARVQRANSFVASAADLRFVLPPDCLYAVSSRAPAAIDHRHA